eukprot:m51a1_g3726 hypothetical protein (316) ;mRNA; f:18256-19525
MMTEDDQQLFFDPCPVPSVSVGLEDVQSHQPPAITVDPSQIFIATTFKVVVTMGAAWMAEYGVTSAEVWASGFRASLYTEGKEKDEHPLAACQKCCASRESSVRVGVNDISVSLSSDSRPSDPLRVFVFDRCRSYCNSSRLHLGGRVRLCLDLRGNNGTTVARVFSDPLSLCSKQSPSGPAEGRRRRAERKTKSSAGTQSPVVPSPIQARQAPSPEMPTLRQPVAQQASVAAPPMVVPSPLDAFRGVDLFPTLPKEPIQSVDPVQLCEELRRSSSSTGEPLLAGPIVEQLEYYERVQLMRYLQIRMIKEQLLNSK